MAVKKSLNRVLLIPMPYRYVEDVTMADVAFVAEGVTLDEMFESAGLAVTNTMVSDPKVIKPKIKKNISLTSSTVEKLLFDYLNEFIYLKDSELLIFSKINAKVSEKNRAWSLSAVLSGDKIDTKRHEMLTDIKAVTMHKFSVEKKGGKWTCHVVLDV